MVRDILILLHECDPYPEGHRHFIWGLHAGWIEAGLDVGIAKGIEELEPARLVIPHVDLTVTPQEYRDVLDALPNVVNRGLYDISKRRVSKILVGADDDYDGPVIVKTDLNYGGAPEQALRERTLSLAGRALERVRSLGPSPRFRWETTPVPPDGGYPIFDSIEEVPQGVWENEHLVVEQFCPEKEGDTYFTRSYVFLGDRHRSVRVASESPIVKGGRETTKEFGGALPPEVLAAREDLSMDYGKIDFVLFEGHPVVLDVNRTMGGGPPTGFAQHYGSVGAGVFSLLDRAARS